MKSPAVSADGELCLPRRHEIYVGARRRRMYTIINSGIITKFPHLHVNLHQCIRLSDDAAEISAARHLPLAERVYRRWTTDHSTTDYSDAVVLRPPPRVSRPSSRPGLTEGWQSREGRTNDADSFGNGIGTVASS